MDDREKRAAKAAWVERKVEWAICAVRIGDAVWVKAVPDVAAYERRVGFSLRTGSPPLPDMAVAYAAARAVSVEMLEALDADLTPMARDTLAKARVAHWAGVLGGKVI